MLCRPGTNTRAGWLTAAAVPLKTFSVFFFFFTGFIFRLSGEDKNELKKGHGLVDAAHDAIRNLEEFWVVGVVEQYGGFLEVLRSLLDPEKKHKEHWNTYSKKHLNS